MFLLAWSYERKSDALRAAGDSAGADEVKSMAEAGYRDVFTEATGVQLKGVMDRKWSRWKDDVDLWLDRAYVYVAAGEYGLTCDALEHVLYLRKASGPTPQPQLARERNIWLMACRCAVRIGASVVSLSWVFTSLFLSP